MTTMLELQSEISNKKVEIFRWEAFYSEIKALLN